jgi:hypothetical protein
MSNISSTALVEGDAQLNNDAFRALHAKYSVLASDEQIAKTKAGLESKGHSASVVSTGVEALELITSLIPDGVSVYNTGSTSLVRSKASLTKIRVPIIPIVQTVLPLTYGANSRSKRWSICFFTFSLFMIG